MDSAVHLWSFTVVSRQFLPWSSCVLTWSSACQPQEEGESQRGTVMTSSVTGRMGKVRHNSLNQSGCLPPLRPPLTNNNAFVRGCAPLVCSQTRTQTKVKHHTLPSSHKETRVKESCRSRAGSRLSRLQELKCVYMISEMSVYACLRVSLQARAHDCSCPLAPSSKPTPPPRSGWEVTRSGIPLGLRADEYFRIYLVSWSKRDRLRRRHWTGGGKKAEGGKKNRNRTGTEKSRRSCSRACVCLCVWRCLCGEMKQQTENPRGFFSAS